jgi:hypothetical protein
MNKRFSVLTVILLGVICLTGCMENAALMKLNKDGSGTLTYRIFMSDDMMQMVQGMSSGMSGDADGEGVDLSGLNPIESIKKEMESKFGDAATLESSKDITNKQGWKGIEGIYKFDDVNKLNLVDMGSEMDSDESSGGMSNMGTPYKFEFSGGDVATLKIVPITTDKEAAEAAVEAAAEDIPEEFGEMGMEGMDDLGLAMMKPMLGGMRITLLVSVDGTIVETNSKFRSEKHPNVVTLMDIRMDKLFDHPEAMGIMSAGDDGADKLAKLNLPGVKIEDPKKEITISFK